MATKTLILRPISSKNDNDNTTESYLNVSEEVADDDATVYKISGASSIRESFYFDNLNYFNSQNFSLIQIKSVKLFVRKNSNINSIQLNFHSNLFSTIAESSTLTGAWETIELDCACNNTILATEAVYIKPDTTSSLAKANTISITQLYLKIDYEEIEMEEDTNNLNITVSNTHKKASNFYLTNNNIHKKVKKIFLTSNDVFKLCYSRPVISFTINGISYDTTLGTTWYEWCNGEGSSSGFTCSSKDSNVFSSDGNIIAVNNAEIKGSHIISNGLAANIIIIEFLQDFEYTDNGNNTYTITGWKGTKYGLNSTEVLIPADKRIIL